MKNKTILIQGAMDIEIETIIKNLDDMAKINISDFEFYTGKINNYKIIVSKTLIGEINSSIATTLGITKFTPDLVINQGIAGAHKEYIHTGDIIIGKYCQNINTYSMPEKKLNEGSNPFEWKLSKRSKAIETNIELVKKFEEFFINNYENKIYTGVLGSGDVFNREIDRINWISNNFNTLSEDMESIATYETCHKLNIPCIGIRIISNNEIIKEPLDETQAIVLQNLIISLLKKS